MKGIPERIARLRSSTLRSRPRLWPQAFADALGIELQKPQAGT